MASVLHYGGWGEIHEKQCNLPPKLNLGEYMGNTNSHTEYESTKTASNK